MVTEIQARYEVKNMDRGGGGGVEIWIEGGGE